MLPWRLPGWTCCQFKDRWSQFPWKYVCEREDVHKIFKTQKDMVAFILAHPRRIVMSTNVRDLNTSFLGRSKKEIAPVDIMARSISTSTTSINTRILNRCIPFPPIKSTSTPHSCPWSVKLAARALDMPHPTSASESTWGQDTTIHAELAKPTRALNRTHPLWSREVNLTLEPTTAIAKITKPTQILDRPLPIPTASSDSLPEMLTAGAKFATSTRA
jgi:hypothetical protein